MYILKYWEVAEIFVKDVLKIGCAEVRTRRLEMALNVWIIVFIIFLIHCVQTMKSIDVNREPPTDWDMHWIKCEEIFFHSSPYYCEFIWFRWISLDRSVDQKDEACLVATDQFPLQQPYWHMMVSVDHTDVQTLSHCSVAGNLGKVAWKLEMYTFLFRFLTAILLRTL